MGIPVCRTERNLSIAKASEEQSSVAEKSQTAVGSKGSFIHHHAQHN